MTEMNSSLIGFLKKKSLFANSPDKLKKSKEHSRDSKKYSQSQKSQKNLNLNANLNNNSNNVYNNNPQRYNQAHNLANSKNMQKHSSVQSFVNVNEDDHFQVQATNSLVIQTPVRPEQKASIDQKIKMSKRSFNFNNSSRQQQYAEQTKMTRQQETKQQNIKNIWTGIINKAVTFQSARLQSAQCLQSISLKLQTEISTINYKLDAFRSKVSQVLDQQLNNLRQKVFYMVQKIFEQSENTMKNYVKEQERVFAKQLISMKQNLVKQYQKVQAMKDQINKSNWKKIAGELLSSSLQQNIDELLEKSKSTSIKHWELRDLGESKLPSLQRQLRNVVKLNST